MENKKEKHSISLKIGLTIFGISLLILISGQSYYSYQNISGQEKTFSELYTNSLLSISYAGNASKNFKDFKQAIFNYTNKKNANKFIIRNIFLDLYEDISIVKERSQGEKSKFLVTDIEKEMLHINSLFSKGNNNLLRTELSKLDKNGTLSKIEKNIEDIIELEIIRAHELKEELLLTNKQNLKIIILSLIITPLMVIVLLVIAHLYIIRPIFKLSNFCKNKENSHHLETILYNSHLFTEIKQLYSSFFDLTKELEERIKKNQDLVKILSHDLNNTLTLILGNAHSLRKKLKKIPLEIHKMQELEKRFDGINQGVRTQQEIIANVAKSIAIKTGKSVIDITAVNFEEVIDKLNSLFEVKLKNKDLKLNFIGANKNFFVMAERTSLIHNILANLISNAIKFSPRGADIDFIVKENESEYLFTLRDYGIGIPKDLQRNIFSMTKQTTRPGTEGEEGTGFGMPLVKTTLEAYGKEIKLRSWTEENEESKQGSEFSFSLDKIAS